MCIRDRGFGIAKRPRQQPAAKRARRRQRERRDEVVRSRAAGPVDHQEWVGAVMDTARREVGVRDAAWSEIERACRGNIRFTFPGSRPGPERAEVFALIHISEEYAKWLACLLYTSDAADEEDSVDLGGRRI